MDGNKYYVLHHTNKQNILEIFPIGKEIPLLARLEEIFGGPLNSANKKIAGLLLDHPDEFFPSTSTQSLKSRALSQNYISVNIYSGIMIKVE